MALPFAFSPSSISTFRDCPRKFKLIKDKVIVFKESPSKERGIRVHKYMEEKISGVKNVYCPEGVDIGYTQGLITRFTKPRPKDTFFALEHEMCVTDKWKPCGWFDENVMIRSRADVLQIDPATNHALIGDFKTGKIYPGMDLQVRVYALLCYVLYGVKNITWELYYLDQGRTKQGTLTFENDLTPVNDVLAFMQSAIQIAQTTNFFPAQRNTFCRFCSAYHDDLHCPESLRW